MPRPIWSGAISFGLVTVPVKLFSAIDQKDIRFNQLERETGARIRYKRVSEATGEEVDYDDIVKGYKLSKDRWVMIDPDELDELDPKATHTVDIQDFVRLDEIDPIYYERTYWLVPDRGGTKAYRLLQVAMEQSQRVGVGTFVMRTKQYLGAVRPLDGALALSTMLFHDEVVPMDAIEGIPVDDDVEERELKMALQLVDALTTEFEPERYRDTYRERVEDLIEKKAAGETFEAPAAAEAPKVVDLLDALKQSLERGGRGGDEEAASRRARASKRSKERRDEREEPERSYEELYELAKKKNIPGRSKMNKEELERAVG